MCVLIQIAEVFETFFTKMAKRKTVVNIQLKNSLTQEDWSYSYGQNRVWGHSSKHSAISSLSDTVNKVEMIKCTCVW